MRRLCNLFSQSAILDSGFQILLRIQLLDACQQKDAIQFFHSLYFSGSLKWGPVPRNCRDRGYVMWKFGVSAAVAIRWIRAARPCIRPNVGFARWVGTTVYRKKESLFHKNYSTKQIEMGRLKWTIDFVVNCGSSIYVNIFLIFGSWDCSRAVFKYFHWLELQHLFFGVNLQS